MRTMKSRIAIFMTTLALVMASSAIPSHALNLVTNGGFETGDFSGWSQSGSYMYVLPSNPYSGSFAAALGTPTVFGTLSQTISTIPGQDYALSFVLANSGGTNAFQAAVNGITVFSEENGGSQSYTSYSNIFTAESASTDIALYARNDSGAFALDDVSVDLAPVPEPATLLLLGAGLSGISFLRKRSKSSKA